MRAGPHSTLRSTAFVPSALLALALALGAGALACAARTANAASTAPRASTLGSSSVTYSSAILDGSVNPRGQSTTYVFQYGTTRSFGSQTPLAPAGSGSVPIKVSQTVTGLQPLTTYHYRISATGPSGTTVGANRTFKTTSVPLSLAIVGVPNPVTFGSAFLVEGTLSGTGAANHGIALRPTRSPTSGAFRPSATPS